MDRKTCERILSDLAGDLYDRLGCGESAAGIIVDMGPAAGVAAGFNGAFPA